MKKLIPAFICLLLAVPCQARIIFVDANTPDSNDGSSWAKAYKYLQDALADANSAGDVNEIRVAQGIYTPDSNSTYPNGSGNREATFQLINGVALKGGYAGFGQPDPNARDIELYETILSGDLDGNDVDVNYPSDLWGEPTRNENSYNVVTGSGTDITSVLDGFTITGGNANAMSEPSLHLHCGGGMFNCEYSNPTLINCIFSGNSAWQGGGMYNGGFDYSNDTGPTLTNCMFTGNSAEHVGGGMANSGDYPTLINCIFLGNSGGGGGGGMNNYISNPTLTGCTFIGNSAPELLIGGGGGGGMGNNRSSPILTNCTFSGNSALFGGGMRNSYESNPTIINCILWDDTPNEIYIYSVGWPGGTPMVTYSDVQGGWPGEGNIDADPCFVEPGYWDSNGVWVEGDYHLLPGSLCIDAATDAGVYTDIEGNSRPFNFPGVDNNGELPEFDMGAYEATAQIAELMILPRVINRHSRQRRILARLRLPEGITRDQIDRDTPLVLYPGNIEAIRQFVFQNRRRGNQHTSPVRNPNQKSVGPTSNGASIFAFFDKAELMDAIGDNDSVELELQVVGRFVSPGQYFYGSDTVRINSRRGRPRGHR